MREKIKRFKPDIKKLKPKKPTRIWYVDNLSGIALGNTISATLENLVYGLTPTESLDARLTSTLVGIAFLNKLFPKTRDFSRKIFDVDLKKSTTKKISLHDSIYCGTFTFGYSTLMYSVIADLSLGETLKASATTGLIYGVLGAAVSYNIDSFRDFFGVSENHKLPNRIRELSSKSKKTLAAGILAVYGTAFSSNYLDYAIGKYDAFTNKNIEIQYVSPNKINLETIVTNKS
jgi:hypothetical protein